jgi:hypothetical protein
MSKTRVSSLLASAFLFVLGPTLHAGIILQDHGTEHYLIRGYARLGQSFTAEDPYVTFGFHINERDADTDGFNVAMALYEGTTIAGATPLLETPEVAFEDDFEGWYDADFSAVALGIDQVYTVVITGWDSNAYLRVNSEASYNYPGGSLLTGWSTWNASRDAVFRVVPVPVPGAVLLGLFGLGYSGLRLRRQRSL